MEKRSFAKKKKQQQKIEQISYEISLDIGEIFLRCGSYTSYRPWTVKNCRCESCRLTAMLLIVFLRFPSPSPQVSPPQPEILKETFRTIPLIAPLLFSHKQHDTGTVFYNIIIWWYIYTINDDRSEEQRELFLILSRTDKFRRVFQRYWTAQSTTITITSKIQ